MTTPTKLNQQLEDAWQSRAKPSVARSLLGPTGSLWITLTALILLSYSAYYAWMIYHHTALPFFDQGNYIAKVRHIQEALSSDTSFWRYFNPSLYLNAQPAMRPPLMMIPAALLFDPATDPRNIAWLWLGLRVAGLWLGIWVLARQLRDWRWAPMGAAILLGGILSLKISPMLYMMDLMFANWGLLAFALLVRDVNKRTAGSAALACLGTLALLLIKPAALTFVFPIWGVRFLAGTIEFFKAARAQKPGVFRETFLRFTRIWIVYGLFVATLLWLYRSDYGHGVAWQYAWGKTGYWDHPTDWWLYTVMLMSLVAPWVAGLALLTSYRALRKPQPTDRDFSDITVATQAISIRRWAVFMGLAFTAWWYIFNSFLTYTVDGRVLYTGLAVTGSTLAIVIAAGWAWARALGTLACLGLYVAGVLIATGQLNQPNNKYAFYLWMQWPVEQMTVSEIGLVPLSVDVIKATKATPEKPENILVLMNDEFVESQALQISVDYAGNPPVLGDKKSFALPIYYQAAPWGSEDFNLEKILKFRWYLTKNRNPTIHLEKDAFTTVLALEALVTDPQSPLAGSWKQTLTRPITRPAARESDRLGRFGPSELIEEQLTLWELTKRPTPQQFLDAIRFVKPRFVGTPGEKNLAAFETRYANIVAKGIAVDTITEEQAAALAQNAQASNITVGDALLLRSARTHSLPDGSLQLTLVWQTTREVRLDSNRYIHLLDDKDKMIAQKDAPLDPLSGLAKPNTLWQDIVTIEPDVAKRLHTIGLGIQLNKARMAKLSGGTGGQRDWSDHRLLLQINKSK